MSEFHVASVFDIFKGENQAQMLVKQLWGMEEGWKGTEGFV
jgi:hypothetical protein